MVENTSPSSDSSTSGGEENEELQDTMIEHSELTKHTVHMVRLYNLHSGNPWRAEHEERLQQYCTTSQVELLRDFIQQFTQTHVLPLAKRLKKEMRTKVFVERSTALISKWRQTYEGSGRVTRRRKVPARRKNNKSSSVNFSAEPQIRFIDCRMDDGHGLGAPGDGSRLVSIY